MASSLGILGGAMKGAGEAGADIVQGWIRNEQALDLERERDSIMMQREQRVAELRERMRREGDAYDWQQKQDRAPTQNKMDAERTGIIGKAQTEVELDRVQKVEPARQEIQRKGKNAEREDALDFETTNIDAIASNARKKADATDRDGEGRALRNDLTRLQIDEAKLASGDRQELRVLRKGYQEAVDSGDQVKIDAAQKKLNSFHNRIGQAEQNEWFTTKDDMGNLVKLNRKTGEMYRVDTENLPTHSSSGRGVPEIRYKDGQAYTRGPNGEAVRAPQYDKKK